MASLEAFSLATSVATIALLVGVACRYMVQWVDSANAAREEMIALIDEGQNTRHALNPIEGYAKAEYVNEDERRLLLSSIGRLRSLNARLNGEMLSLLDDRVSEPCRVPINTL
jgi:DNA-binding transcriptional regulator YdaS (Cro superfamily)